MILLVVWAGFFQFIKEEVLGFKEATDDSSESLSENANSLAENAEHGRGMLSFLTPARLAVGGLVGVASLLAIAWYKGSQEASEFNKQLILTGNYAGKTAGQLSQLSRQIADDAGVTIGESSATLAKIVGSGRFDGNKLEVVARAAAAMQDAVGQSVDTTIANFQKLNCARSKLRGPLIGFNSHVCSIKKPRISEAGIRDSAIYFAIIFEN